MTYMYISELVWIGWRWLEETTGLFRGWLLYLAGHTFCFVWSPGQRGQGKCWRLSNAHKHDEPIRFTMIHWNKSPNHKSQIVQEIRRVRWILMVLVILIQLAAHWGFPHWQRAHCLRGLVISDAASRCLRCFWMLKLHHCEAAIMRAAEDTSNSVLPSGVTGNNSLPVSGCVHDFWVYSIITYNHI